MSNNLVLGVEGSIHASFRPILKTLAEQQIDSSTNLPYAVAHGHESLRAAIFGSKHTQYTPINDPQLIQFTINDICPDDGQKHIIIEDNSFPSGGRDSSSINRIPRQQSWNSMNPAEIATSTTALNHPTNLYDFYNAFSPYVDIKFIVLQRPYIETIASKSTKYDGGSEQHSIIISGFLLILHHFLINHMYNTDGAQLWTMVCSEYLSRHHNILYYLTKFLGWNTSTCIHCFDSWSDTTVPQELIEERLGSRELYDVLIGHSSELEKIWPPRRKEDSLLEQQCGIN